MRRRENIYNPKRSILPADQWSTAIRLQRAGDAQYGGNPEHKMNPGDYGLTPPASPRPGKTLCDSERDLLRAEALTLLRSGLQRGVVSAQMRNGWPQNVWAVSENGEVFESQLENQATGTYHGYPMPEDDDFRELVLQEWRSREG